MFFKIVAWVLRFEFSSSRYAVLRTIWFSWKKKEWSVKDSICLSGELLLKGKAQ
jgi:hypothetical protein